ncbi:DNA-protecting protein DprA [Marinobacter halodurans]|uniref:DNA-protecting protein DprA n=1 Tax=Marinobacter halodurans TaxID=2528979 RepID=A0ABY1ZNP5_9GAMM|nr:DNA-processing protein DprA [Marinobacter halodurans]TBW56470.1 DNA-protecting protein DprA [Marinobacter halodurans]
MTDTTLSSNDTFLRDHRSPWLLLAHLPGLGERRWQAILDHLPDPSELLTLDPASLRTIGLPPLARAAVLAWQQGDPEHPAMQDALACWQRLEAHTIDVIHWAQSDYPAALRQIHGAPPVLYLKGRRDLLSRPQIAIVGSRNATRSGLDHARQFARALAERGVVVTSGMALGIDGAAHQGALEAGGSTLAVLGTGVDVAYPAAHRRLAAAIPERGALLSEFPPGTRARAGHFPRRNRIISGMAQGTLVVEAGLRSGSLITARLALEQGREIFAIPGSIHNPLARGCHQLIRQGATLVESVQDIEEQLAAWGSAAAEPLPVDEEPDVPAHLGADARTVFGALAFDPCSTDDLCDRTGLSADVLLQAILMLEMEGLVLTVPGGYQRA